MSAAEPGPVATVALFGLLSCARLAAFERRAADAGLAVSYADKVVLGGLAVGAFTQFERLRDRLVELGADPLEAMEPFHEVIGAFHERTRPADALEALAKVYLADTILADLYVAAAGAAGADTRSLVAESLADSGHTARLIERLRAAIESDSRLASRLALWARRLVGEALCQAHAIAGHAALKGLVGEEEAEASVGGVIAAHAARMRAISLSD